MITRRVVVNLVTFAVVSLALIGYGLFDLLGNPFASPTTVSTVMPTTAGLAPGFTVSYDGIDVGSVSAVSLVPGGARVTMAIDPGAHVPSDVAAQVIVGNALGEQEVQLVPRQPAATAAAAGSATAAATAAPGAPGSGSAGSATPGGASGGPPRVRTTAVDRTAPLHDGQVLPVAPDSAPAAVGTLVTEATNLLNAIPAGDLNSLLHQAALALNGQADNLKTIASASATFAREFLDYQSQFQALLANSPPVLDTVTADATALQQSLAETATVLSALAAHRGDVVNLLNEGSVAATDLNSLVTDNRANLGCLVHDLSDTAANLDQPTNLGNLATALAQNGTFFSIVQRVAPEGPARGLTSTDTTRNDQVQLRTHILLPPSQPPAVTYGAAHGLTTIRPGAGCSTEFGAGAGPVQQAGFTPADGGTVSQATAAQAQVRGGGPVDPLTGNATAAAARLHPAHGSLWPLLAVAAIAVAAAVAASRRRQVRTAATGGADGTAHAMSAGPTGGGGRRAPGRRAGVRRRHRGERQ